jgi:uroporphyrinogen-III decarboxylase
MTGETNKAWKDMTWEEKREERFKKWLNPGISFESPEAEKRYQERVTRFIKAIKLEEPDRVPVMLPIEHYPAYYAGSNCRKVMYDYEEMRKAWLKFIREFDSDSFNPPSLILPGKVLEMIDYKVQKWPGCGLAEDAPSQQYVEGEYMKVAEYDAFIQDPADFIQRYFLPRSAGVFAPLSKLPRLQPMVSIPLGYIAAFGDPEVSAAYRRMIEAGEETLRWASVVGEVAQIMLAAGFPTVWGGMSGAPFDQIGDFMRGTQGIMMDMFQRPAKLQEAMERLVPIIINEAVESANASTSPIIFMPLHKGTGGFMSPKQFDTFYWPTFRKVLMGIIEEGLIPMPFAEGNFEPRLETIADMPRSSMVWFFEQMDLVKAKNILGDVAGIAGGVPASALCTGTPQDVKEASRKAIEICAPGGGFILTAGVHMDEGDPENLRAMMTAAKEYGVYKQ